MIPLTFANEGSLVQIVEVRAGQGLTRRLAELGLTQGSTLRVVKSSPPGPVIVEVVNGNGYVEGWRVVLGFGMAMKVFVENRG